MARRSFLFALVGAAACLPTPAAALQIRPPPTGEEAIERQREEVREIVTRPCRRGDAEDGTIVVCGGWLPPETARTGYDPSREFAAPAQGPWFERRLGPVSLSCCAIANAHGTGAGFSLRVRF